MLQVVEKTLHVDGREAAIFALEQKDGTLGLSANKGEMFHVKLENKLQDPTSVHWHGLILPNNQDGVAFVTQYPIYPGLSYIYHFPIVQSGTFWMHSHIGLQEQRLLTAPLIIYDADDKEIADQEAVNAHFESSQNDRAAVQNDSSSLERLIQGFNATVFPFERIRGCRFVSYLPRSPLGKIIRSELLKLFVLS